MRIANLKDQTFCFLPKIPGLNVEVTARNSIVAYYQPSDSRLRGKDGQEREKLQQGLASKTGIRI